MSTISDLPIEIISQIDYYLYSNNDRLTCLAVCSTWYHLFKPTLYHCIRVYDQTQFINLYQQCITAGHFVKSLDISEVIQPKQVDRLLLLCPKLESLYYNSWDQQEEECFHIFQHLKLYSISTLNLQSMIGFKLFQTCSMTLTDVTISVCLPLKLVPMKQLESLSINIHYESMYSVSIVDLEHIHRCYPKLNSLCIYGNQELRITDNIEQKTSTIQPCLLTVFKFNQVQNSNHSIFVKYICTKYPLLRTLELECPIVESHGLLESSWYKLALYCRHLQHLSLFGFTLDQKFFSTFLKCKLNIKVLKLSTVTQCTIIPISSILKTYQDTLEEYVFWPGYIIRPTLDLIHSNLALCHKLQRLNISGIHLYHNEQEKDVYLDIPMDTIIQYGKHLKYLKLEYATISYHQEQQQLADKKSSLIHVSLQHVTLSNSVIEYLGHTCPKITHFSLVYCQFLDKRIEIQMPEHRFDFFNLHYPYTLYDSFVKKDYLIQFNSRHYYYQTHTQHWLNIEKKEKITFNNNRNIIVIIIQYSSIDQSYIFNEKRNIK